MATSTTEKTDKQVHDQRVKYINREFGSLVGKKIALVRPLTRAEANGLAWEYDYESEAFVIIFTDGTAVIPMCDPEGNGAGHLLIAETEVVK